MLKCRRHNPERYAMPGWRRMQLHHAVIALLLLISPPSMRFRSAGQPQLLPTVQAFQQQCPLSTKSYTASRQNHNIIITGQQVPKRSNRMRLYSSSSSSSSSATSSDKAVQELMAEFDPILLFVSRWLPRQTAQEAGALYAWCRRLDEICDDPTTSATDRQQTLDDWEVRLDALWKGHPVDELDAALTDCVKNNNQLSQQPFRDMIAGMRSDAVENRRIATLTDLEEYGYQVAGTVGLMLLPLLKAPLEAKEPAIALGTAIQLINILRDASQDVDLGRIYLPQDLLKAQNVLEADIMTRKTPSKGYRAVTKLVSDRAAQLLEQAETGKATLPGMGPLLVQIIVELYRGYLEELERRDYDNLSFSGEYYDGERRVKISTARKLTASLTAIYKVIASH